MTKAYFPFNEGLGATSYQDRWTKILRECRLTGVLPGVMDVLEPYGDSTGMQVKIRSGAAIIMGHYYENDEVEILAIAAADPSYPRIDRAILRLDWVNCIIDTVVLTGTPAPSPIPPELTRVDLSTWEMPLAQVTVGAGVVTIEASNVFDERDISRESVSLAMVLALS